MVFKKSVSVQIFSFKGCTCTVLDIVAAKSQSYIGFLRFFILVVQGLFKRLLHKYHRKFVKTYQKQPNKLHIRQFIRLAFKFEFYLRFPPQDPTLESHPRIQTPPQCPTLGSHLRILLRVSSQSPTLGSHSRVPPQVPTLGW